MSSWNPSKQELLQATVEHIDIKRHNVVPLVESMKSMAYSARDLARAADILDRWVREGKYPNRSRALQAAVNLLSEREKRTRLERELAKIDPKEEKQMAEQGLGDAAWPEY